MTLGLLKTAELGRLKTGDSAYRKPQLLTKHWNSCGNRRPSNDADKEESFGFLLTQSLAVDDLLAWLADGRVRVGDAVPQVREAIGRAMLRTETALAAVPGASFPDIDGGER